MIYSLSVFLEFRLRVGLKKQTNETKNKNLRVRLQKLVVAGDWKDMVAEGKKRDCESRVLGNACEFHSWDRERW